MKHLIYSAVSLLILGACNKPKSKSDDPAPAPTAGQSGEVVSEKPPGTPSVDPIVVPDNRPVAATVSTYAFDCAALDSGIYWFGKGDLAQKSSLTTKATFFDPTKPTVICTHGWQAASHARETRTTFNYGKYDPIFGLKVDAADAWIDAGWNIGIFYWNQISDELTPNAVENKLWGASPVTWKDCKGKDLPVDGNPASVVDVFLLSYKDALKDYKGANIRLVGHSLGNQLVTRLADKLASESLSGTIPTTLVPKRVALIDPWWSAATRNENRAATLRMNIESLKAKGMIFEWYRASNLNDNFGSDDNAELIPIIGRTEWELDYYSSRNQAARHGAAAFHYFLSFAEAAPKGCALPCTDIAASAATPDARMFELMNKGVHWQQVGGSQTPSLSDNTFEIKTK